MADDDALDAELLELLLDELEPLRLDDDEDAELLVDETGSRPMAVTVPWTGVALPSGVTLASEPMCTLFRCRSVIVVATWSLPGPMTVTATCDDLRSIRARC